MPIATARSVQHRRHLVSLQRSLWLKAAAGGSRRDDSTDRQWANPCAGALSQSYAEAQSAVGSEVAGKAKGFSVFRAGPYYDALDAAYAVVNVFARQ